MNLEDLPPRYQAQAVARGASPVEKRLVARQVESRLELALLAQIRDAGLPVPQRQAKVIPGRRYAFDFYWPDYHVAVEVDGDTFGRKCGQCGDIKAGGGHTRGAGYESDRVKDNEATLLGVWVLRVTRHQVEDGSALGWIVRALNPSKAHRGEE